MNDLKETYNEIERIFGIEAVNKIKDIIGKLLMKINDLEKSRDKWREECLEIKQLKQINKRPVGRDY